MLRTLLMSVCVLAMLPTASSAVASTVVQADPGIFEPINAFVNAFNSAWQGGSTDFPADLFTDDIAVTDLFPPFYWHGRSDVAAWFADIMPSGGDRSQAQHVVIGAPLIVTIGAGAKRSTTGTGDTAYVVVPATLTYNYKGQPQTTKAVWSWILHRGGTRWRISAHSWATTSETQPHSVQYLIRVPWATPTPEPVR